MKAIPLACMVIYLPRELRTWDRAITAGVLSYESEWGSLSLRNSLSASYFLKPCKVIEHKIVTLKYSTIINRSSKGLKNKLEIVTHFALLE